MTLLYCGVCFLAALWVTWTRGAAHAFAYLYVPALLLLSKGNALSLPFLPDANPPDAVLYAILGVSALRAQRPAFTPCWADVIVGLIVLEYAISAWLTHSFRSAINNAGVAILELAAPYYLARSTLGDAASRRRFVIVLGLLSVALLLIALVEFRLWPFWYDDLLRTLRIGDPIGGGAQGRWGYFRAMVSFEHPIDLSLGGALLFAMIGMLGPTARPPLPRRWLTIGLVSSIALSFSGVSYTALMGLTAASAVYLTVRYVKNGERYVVLGVMFVVLVGILYTRDVASQPLPERPPDEQQLELSYWVRQLIIKEAWSAATTAGPFGWGEDLEERIGELRSLDNAYLLITGRNGWLALVLWLLFPVFVARLTLRGLRTRPSPERYQATLLGLAAVIGTMVAMYTVWMGFVYQTLFMLTAAVAVNSAVARRPAVVAAPGRARAPATAPLRAARGRA